MPTDRQDWIKECEIINPKYQCGVDAYEFLMNNSSRIIQLSTIAKLTTDNKSIITDFPINYDIKGMEPYSNYTIKVCDTYGTVLYIFVHSKGATTYLLPVVIGFEDGAFCAPMKLTDNWRIRNISANYAFSRHAHMEDESIMRLVDFSENHYRPRDIHIMTAESRNEFGIIGEMLIVDTTSGIFDGLSVLSKSSDKNLLDVWSKSEKESLEPKLQVTTFSSSSLVLQIWLHTVCMWRKRCLDRQIKVVSSSGGSVRYTDSIKSELNRNKQVVVDINKDIVVYINDSMTKREFRGYHMYESSRCGHFRHMKSGKISYIPPTTVYYKKLVPELYLQSQGARTVIYRNTEDFLKEKSYLENDVMLMLKAKGIKYNREQTFSWMGRKRLDFYLPEKNIAIECQGVQHFYKYGADDTELKNRQRRDEDKYNECMANGIKIFYFMSDVIPVPEDMLKKHEYITDLDELYKRIADF